MTPLETALEAMDSLYFSKNDVPNKQVIRARTRAMVRAYDFVWLEKSNGYYVRGAERLLMGPLRNLETGRDSGYIAAGKLDIILQEKSARKRLLVLDHKFLGQGFDDDDIEHLLVSGQQNQYAYLGIPNGIRFQGAIWDIIVKSKHIPRKESILKGKPERIAGRKSVVDGVEYAKGDIIPATPDVVTPGETMDEFEERVFQLYCEDPTKYFARPEVPVIESNIANHIHEVYLWTKELDMDSKGDNHLRNPDACMEYNRPCSYLGLCSGRSHEEDGTWKHGARIHNELDLEKGVDPFKIITNSRLKMFRTCRLKHHRKYNLGLVKIEENIDEALFVGSAGHVGLEYWWKQIASEDKS